MNLIITGVFAGVLGTIAMDLLNSLFSRYRILIKIDMHGLGKMCAGWMRGRFHYNHPDEMEEVAYASILGYVTHYAIGIALGIIFILGWALFIGGPASPVWALAYGMGTTLASHFIVLPSMGFGILGWKSPERTKSMLSPLANHLFYGIGLAIGITLLRVM